MKRIIVCCWLFCVILGLFGSSVIGEETTVYLSDIDMTISFPEDSIICTLNMEEVDPVMKMIGITPEAVRDILIAHERSAEAYNIELPECIYVKGQKSAEYSFSAMPDAFFEELPKSIKQAVESAGQKILNQDVVEINGVKYIVTERYLCDDADTYILEYLTIRDYMGYTIGLQREEGGKEGFSDTDRDMLRKCVESIYYGRYQDIW